MVPSLELEEVVRTLKLRGNASGISLHLSKADLKNMLLMPQQRGPASIAESTSSKLAIEDGAVDSQSSDASVASEESCMALQPIAAKLAATAREPPSRKKSVADTLAELKHAVKAAKAEESPAPTQEKDEGKQPKKPGKGVKRPQDDEEIVKSDDKPKAKKRVEQAEPKEKPKKKTKKQKAVKKKKELKMTRKCYTSRAYHAVLLKKSKVMSVERAKVFAREAHQKAGEEWDEKHKL